MPPTAIVMYRIADALAGDQLEDNEKGEIGEKGMGTMCVHAGEVIDPSSGTIVTPIYQNATFLYPYAIDGKGNYTDKEAPYFYTRLGNPTVRSLENRVAALEHAEDAVAFSSGMAAISTAVLSVLGEKGHLLSVRDIYGGTHSLFASLLPSLGHNVTFFDRSRTKFLEELLKTNTRAVYVETPTNPTLDIYDVSEIFEFAHAHDLVTIIDNTFPTPINMQPSRLGADVIVHSATKYLSGHSDVIAGIVAGRGSYVGRIREMMTILGGSMEPFTAFLTERGIKTLELRVKKSNANATALAEFLNDHRRISRVLYPGLEGHEGHDVAERLMSGYGGVLSFELRGRREEARNVLRKMKIAKIAASLGGVESLVTMPIDTSHRQLKEAELKERGISETLIRMSVGIEDEEDLVDDVAQALEL